MSQIPMAFLRDSNLLPSYQSGTSNHGYERLLSLMQGMLRRMANMDITLKPSPRVKQVWVKNNENIHPLRGTGLT
jgi:hypothetical protein